MSDKTESSGHATLQLLNSTTNSVSKGSGTAMKTETVEVHIFATNCQHSTAISVILQTRPETVLM